MSQNSQLNGQPRHHWMPMWLYLLERRAGRSAGSATPGRRPSARPGRSCAAVPAVEVREERRQGDLALAQDEVARLVVQVRARRGVGAADDDPLAPRAAPCGSARGSRAAAASCRPSAPCRPSRARCRPRRRRCGRRASPPSRGQQRRDRAEPQRRRGVARVDELAGLACSSRRRPTGTPDRREELASFSAADEPLQP